MGADYSDVIRALYSALESGTHGDELRSLFTDDAVTIEHPNLIKPVGAVSNLQQMLDASAAGVDLLAWQRYGVRDIIDADPIAIVRATWTGEIKADIGSLRAGQLLTAHIVQFIEVRDGKIVSVETYDCYEPF